MGPEFADRRVLLLPYGAQARSSPIVEPEAVFPEIRYERFTVETFQQQTERDELSGYSTGVALDSPWLQWAVESDFAQLEADLRNAFSGHVVVDLGAGTRATGYKLAAESGATAYAAVELWNPDRLVQSIEAARVSKPIPAMVMRGNLVDFLRALPSGSSSIIASGLDDNIISGREARDTSKEIQRVLHPTGAFLRVKSNIPKISGLLKLELARDVELYRGER